MHSASAALRGGTSLRGLHIAPPVREAVRLPAWIRVVIAVAAVKIIAAVAAAPAGEGGGRVASPAVFLLLIVVFAGAGCALLVLGRADRRAVSLGVFFLLVATSFGNPLVLRALGAGFPAAPALRFLQAIQVEVFEPYFFWMFVRDFPRTHRKRRRSRLFYATIRATLAAGCLLLAANAALAYGVPGTAGEWAGRWLGRDTPGSLYWRILFLPILAAAVYALRRTREAGPDERRRVRILVGGLVLGAAPIVFLSLLAALVPAFFRYRESEEGFRALRWVVYPSILAMPLVIAYAVLAHGALDLRFIMRRALRYAAAQYTVAAVAAVPFVWLGTRIYVERERSLADLWSGTTGVLFTAAAVAGGALLLLRPRFAQAIDRRFFREQYDARGILARLVEQTRAAPDPAALAAAVVRELDDALHLRSVSAYLRDPATGSLADPSGAQGPLPAGSEVVRRVEAEGGALDVDWSDSGGWLSRLGEADRRWLADVDARLLVPLSAADGSLLGLLVLGEKQSELPFTGDDRLFLGTVSSSVALAVEHRLAAAGPLAPLAARECTGCGAVLDSHVHRCAGCGRDTTAAPVPPLLAGKFRVRERLGSGGMGVVYRAEDLALGRDVAIKTLPRLSSREASRLRREARAMAAVGHPNLALIFGAESWEGMPMLVVEYLPGGTLADHLARGPMPPADALAVAEALTRALARLHDSTILHRDVKPSNIGFAGDGTPKLLDFGLARVLEAAHAADPDIHHWRSLDAASTFPAEPVSVAGEWTGTPLYLSPEVLNGDPPDASADLWALAMVLYEALAGRHPLSGETPHWALLRVAEGDLPDPGEVVPGLPAAVAGFLRTALHADRARRPQSAREFEHRLRELRAIED